MKPKLNGNLADLYENRATIQRKTANFNGVEWISKRDLTAYGYGLTYLICCAGVNSNGVQIAAYFEPGVDKAYFWQYADRAAVADIIETPANAYNWRDVKNGIKKPQTL